MYIIKLSLLSLDRIIFEQADKKLIKCVKVSFN